MLISTISSRASQAEHTAIKSRAVQVKQMYGVSNKNWLMIMLNTKCQVAINLVKFKQAEKIFSSVKQTPEVFHEIIVLKNFTIFMGKHLCWSFFSISLLKRDSSTGVFLVFFEKNCFIVRWGNCSALFKNPLISMKCCYPSTNLLWKPFCVYVTLH